MCYSGAAPMVPERLRLVFEAESSSIRWAYHTVRTHANFYESCRVRDELLGLAGNPQWKPQDCVRAEELLSRWREVLLDEEENTKKASPDGT